MWFQVPGGQAATERAEGWARAPHFASSSLCPGLPSCPEPGVFPQLCDAGGPAQTSPGGGYALGWVILTDALSASDGHRRSWDGDGHGLCHPRLRQRMQSPRGKETLS